MSHDTHMMESWHTHECAPQMMVTCTEVHTNNTSVIALSLVTIQLLNEYLCETELSASQPLDQGVDHAPFLVVSRTETTSRNKQNTNVQKGMKGEQIAWIIVLQMIEFESGSFAERALRYRFILTHMHVCR